MAVACLALSYGVFAQLSRGAGCVVRLTSQGFCYGAGFDFACWRHVVALTGYTL